MEPIQGNVSIDAQNIMPIIKKWLYSDKDIFIREVVSNGCDAITKLRMVDSAAAQNCSIHVEVDKAARELRFTDDGIGMTEDEVKTNITRSPSPAQNPSWRNTPRTRIRKLRHYRHFGWASTPCS